ncbi:MAG: WXG100 family type VII secretion target [Pseudonocardiaceae bacterium]
MSGEILVTFGEISNAQQSVANTSRNVQQQLEDLKSFLQPMVSTWTGQAAEDYQVKQAQWDKSAAELNQVLSQIGVALGTANDNYQQAERSNAARWA